jgi:hypothetical protein
LVTAKLPELYQRAKLAIGHSDHSTWGYHSNRIHLAIGNGGLYVCNDFPGIEALYEPQKHCITYPPMDDPAEVASFIDELLMPVQQHANDHIRREGFLHAQAHHNYYVRCEQLWQLIKDRM